MTTTCANNDAAFSDYGIDHGINILHSTRYQLLNQCIHTFEPTNEFFTQLARAFRTAFIRFARIPLIPDALDIAIDDATAVTAHEFQDQPEADLRYTILPAFYRTVTEFYCAYRDEHSREVGFWIDDNDDNGGIHVIP